MERDDTPGPIPQCAAFWTGEPDPAKSLGESQCPFAATKAILISLFGVNVAVPLCDGHFSRTVTREVGGEIEEGDGSSYGADFEEAT